MGNRWTEFCPGCGRFVFEEPAESGARECRDCGFVVEYLVAPARAKPAAGARSRLEGESACFNHPLKLAEHECAGCGKFLCALCAVELGGARICPECLHAGRTRRSQAPGALADRFVEQAFVPGEVALRLSFVSVVFLPTAVLFAPIALVLSIWGLIRPGGLVGGSRLPAVGALTVLTAGAVGYYLLFT
jgi:hypothetical protein